MNDRMSTLDTVATAALVALWAETLVALPSLPSIVATSFASDGSPQSYSNKFILLGMPAIAAVLFLVVTLTIRAKARLNLPFMIPQERMDAIMPVSEFFQRIVRAELLVGFVALQWSLLQSAKAAQLDASFVPFILTLVALVLTTVALFMVRVWRISRG